MPSLLPPCPLIDVVKRAGVARSDELHIVPGVGLRLLTCRFSQVVGPPQ
jgi:hypothetical protein